MRTRCSRRSGRSEVRARILLLVLIAAAVPFAVACTRPSDVVVMKNAATPTPLPDSAYDPTTRPLDGRRINLADAKKEFDAGSAVFVDVRGPGSFEKEHVKGALNITLSDLEANLDKLPKNKKIVVYCSCDAEHSSANWVDEAETKGIKNAYALIGGTQAWVDAGFPTEKND